MMAIRRPRAATALSLLGAAVACLALPLWWRRRLFGVEVAGESMSPALLPGDFVLLRRGPPRHATAAGRIVLTSDPRPEGGGRLLLKRIVGLPGETVRAGAGVQIDGRYLIEPYAHGEAVAAQYRAVQRLADDTYFLLGDHRAASTDSRDFGAVPRARLEGTAVLRYWPPRRAGVLTPPRRRFLGPAIATTMAAEAAEDTGSH